jgi:SHS family lactate transporter-like MFS transporter
MTAAAETVNMIPWWREPTKEQWLAWWAAWLGWTLDAFDFTVFLLIMVPIADEFRVSITAVTAVFTLTLWLRLLGAVGSGWLADRIGRKTPLMISVAWYSACNFIAGFAPAFWFLFLFRALLGIGMGAEWPAGASLAMESWPARSRGFMSGLLQGSWSLGFLLSSAVYGLFYNAIGWRGMLWIGILPAFAIIVVRRFVREPEIWVENRRRQRLENREVHAPLVSIFKQGLLLNTLTACWWMGSSFVIYYSIWVLFPVHLQKDLQLSPALVATPLALANLVGFLAMGFWGWTADHIGRRASMIIPAVIMVLVAPFYLFNTNFVWVAIGFIVQAAFGGAIYSQNPSYLNERFPTEVRATAIAFCYHQGAIWGGLAGLIVSYFAVNDHMGFVGPMLMATILGELSFTLAVLVGPETSGKQLDSILEAL